MEEEAMAARYWCHMCSQMVSPIMESEIKCPFCLSGFVEEMSSGGGGGPTNARQGNDPDSDLTSERALSLWAPILIGMMGNPRRRRRFRRLEVDTDGDGDGDDLISDTSRTNYNNNDYDDSTETSELDRELESIIRRRRRSSATILQLLQGIRAGSASESENSDGERNIDRERATVSDRERERERVILINPFNQAIILQGSQNENQTTTTMGMGSLGDYFIGPGLDLLLQHLAENDPNRYGTPPALREAVEALPTVTIKEYLQCSVCLDDFEIGCEAKEMPCKHKFHSGCILPWLDLHSSCPVCRHQFPAIESKRESDGGPWNRNGSNQQRRESENSNDVVNGEVGNGDGTNAAASGRGFTFPWPFNGLFSSSSSSSSSSGANGTAANNGSQTNDNS